MDKLRYTVAYQKQRLLIYILCHLCIFSESLKKRFSITKGQSDNNTELTVQYYNEIPYLYVSVAQQIALCSRHIFVFSDLSQLHCRDPPPTNYLGIKK